MSAGNGSGAAARRRRVPDENTRETVLAAALDTICDLGYYQASSNEIARRAGVSWGVIQHYFGTRERLLVAVLDDAVDHALASLDGAELVGRDQRMRLRQLLKLIYSFYGTPMYAATLQILWNLARDTQTERSSELAVRRHAEVLDARWHDLLTAALDAPPTDAAVWMAFTLMWGVAMEQTAASYMNQPIVEQARLPIEYRIEITLDALEGLFSRNTL